MTTLWLIRHGETDWNLQRRFQGSSDRPLNAMGRQQAKALVERLRGKPFDVVYSSDLIRVTETLRLALGDETAFISDPRLREIGFGIFEGLTYEEIKQQHPDALAAWEANREDNPHGGDRLADVVTRIESFLNDIRAKHKDQRVLVFAHGGTLGILLALALSVPPQKWWQFRLMNCTVTEVNLYPPGSILNYFNDSAHLAHLLPAEAEG